MKNPIRPIDISFFDSAPKLPLELEPFLVLIAKPLPLPSVSLPLLVCRSCQACLLPKSLLDHLRKHHQLPVEFRGAVRSLVSTLPELDFDDVPSNADGSAPVEALRVVDAFQCKHCSFIRRDVTDVRKHINQEHNTSAAENYDKIQAQSWFGGRRAVYWRVCLGMTDAENEKHERENYPSLCAWGLFGGVGFGHRKPVSWNEAANPDDGGKTR